MSVYSQMKIFHYQDKLKSLPESVNKILPPIHIRIKPTNFCAHHCSYCAYQAPELELGSEMSERDSLPREKMMEIVDDMDSMGVRAVTFSGGGDPFYYQHLAETVRKLSATSVNFAALTNGARLKGELAELFASGGSWIRISIDGWDDKSYSEYRNIKEGEFTAVMDNIAAFSKLSGSCHLGAVIVVDKKNADHVYELVSSLRNAGADSVKISPCIVSNDGRKNNEYHQPVFNKVKSAAKRAIEQFSGPEFEIYDSYHLLDTKFTKNYTWCANMQVLPVIGADQNVYSCHDKAYTQSGLLGSIKDMGFAEFWLADKSKFFTIDPSVHCNHHCVENNKNKLTLDYLGTDINHLAFV
ncbi:Radical SAM domain protein [hydrothermal vent metagenome]|uniref:Radical SAM domain protein n=1 Tax=hydrothermal vent metagenome TaxID=652676 RepID=A0A3B1CAX4_9ZZZZ